MWHRLASNVAHIGVSSSRREHFSPSPTGESRPSIRGKICRPGELILHIGNPEPHRKKKEHRYFTSVNHTAVNSATQCMVSQRSILSLLSKSLPQFQRTRHLSLRWLLHKSFSISETEAKSWFFWQSWMKPNPRPLYLSVIIIDSEIERTEVDQEKITVKRWKIKMHSIAISTSNKASKLG